MIILVTGGAGYIGNSLVSILNTCPSVERVVVYDNLSAKNIGFFLGNRSLEKIDFVQGDILDSFSLENSLKNIDTVIHLAAHVAFPFNHIQNLQYEQINRWGTLNLVRAINSSSVTNALYLSSAAVYGFKESISETDIPFPENAYSSSKFNGEQQFSLLDKRIRRTIIRAGNVFGFNQCLRTDGVINAFIFEAITKGKINIYGDGEQGRGFVSLNKLVNQIKDWTLDPKDSGINLSLDFNASLNDIKDWILQTQPTLEYQYLNQNEKFSGQSFEKYSIETKFLELMATAYNEFLQNLRIKKH